MQTTNTKNLYVLIGPPCTGKSTWIKKNGFISDPDCKIISSDNIVEELVSARGLTYDDFFQSQDKNLKWKHRVLFEEQFKDIPDYKNIILDLTNLNVKSRKGIMGKIPDLDERYKISVVFRFKGREETILKMMEKRSKELEKKGKKKTIPMNVMLSMFSSFEPPQPEEGFDLNIEVDNTDFFIKVLNGE
jgi:predicted kinase